MGKGGKGGAGGQDKKGETKGERRYDMNAEPPSLEAESRDAATAAAEPQCSAAAAAQQPPAHEEPATADVEINPMDLNRDARRNFILDII